MPSRINGIGTWYCGKSNLRTHRDRCESCGAYADLRSYDTTLYFTVLFIPVIPLGRKRVINECPRCTRHRAANLRQFQDARDKDILEALAAFKANPHDPEKARAAVGAALAYEAEQEFLTVAPVIEQAAPKSPGAQAAVAAGYSHFGRTEQAEAAYERALRLNPNDRDVRRAAAVFYLKNDRPADARPHVRQALESRNAEDLPLLFLLAESYQATGDHAEALAALREGAEAFPAAASDAEFQRLTQVSETNLATGKRVRSAALDGMRSSKLRPRPDTSLIPKLLFPALVVLAFAAYVGTAFYKGAHRTVYVVNGLERAYDVDLNGHRVRVPARSHAEVDLPEGDISVALADPALAAALPARTCSVRTSFWGRPFAKDAFVINPDGTAVVYVEEVTYSADSLHPTVPGGTNPHRLYAGGLLYAMDKIDYPFTTPPQSIEGERSRAIVKRHLAQITEAGPVETAQVVLVELGKAALAPMLRNAALCNPTDRRYVLMAAALLPPDEALSLLQPRLSVRPVLVEWHRAYQQLSERLHPDHDLAAEYRALLAKEPNDTTLLYLLGRVTDDRAEARRLFTRAAEGKPPVAYGYHALAYDALATGDFAKAVEFARSAQRVAPGTMEDSRAYEADALQALGRYDEVLAIVRQDAAKSPRPDGELALREVELLAGKGDVAGARAAAQTFRLRLMGNPNGGGAGPRDAGARWQAHADAAIAYVTGDRAGYAARLKSMPGGPTPAQQFQAALTEGRLDDAAGVLDKAQAGASEGAGGEQESEPSIVTGEIELLMFAAAADAGRADLADAHLKAAVAIYGRGSKEERLVARWLGPTGTKPDPDEAAALTVPPEQKRFVLTALGMRYPADRARHFANAARFNFSRSFPYLTIKQLIGQQNDGGDGAGQNTRSSPRRAATR